MAQQNSRAAAIVDIHAHILPGLDDGSYDWEATDADVQYVGEIAPALAEQGFTFSTGSST